MDQLINYTLHLADSNLILTQRNAAWCGHGPILEQDIAITNITLDLIGQSRNLYQYAASLINEKNFKALETNAPSPLEKAGDEVLTEDSLAYFRNEREFKNLLLTEQENGDWAKTILRQFFYSVYQFILYEEMQQSDNKQLAGIASKSLKEVTYHVTWSGDWVARLGDGTQESHERLQNALNELWPYTGEMFTPADYETEMILAGVAPDVSFLKEAWLKKVSAVFYEATLTLPQDVFMHTGGKNGVHTEKLGYILAELQYLPRTYPTATW
ncbi:MAG: 1,2-phenylacetyl-CoA epoxidase subunit PaaC [Ferruginibacter sp.]